MKITKDYPSTEYIGYDNIEEAMNDSLTPSAYSYEDQLEKHNIQIEKLQECLSKLVCNLVNGKVISLSQLEELLGFNFKVEDD